jgi:hypothetical protein
MHGSGNQNHSRQQLHSKQQCSKMKSNRW